MEITRCSGRDHNIATGQLCWNHCSHICIRNKGFFDHFPVSEFFSGDGVISIRVFHSETLKVPTIPLNSPAALWIGVPCTSTETADPSFRRKLKRNGLALPSFLRSKRCWAASTSAGNT